MDGLPRVPQFLKRVLAQFGLHVFIHAAVVFAPVAALTSMWWAVRPGRKRLLWGAVAQNPLRGRGARYENVGKVAKRKCWLKTLVT